MSTIFHVPENGASSTIGTARTSGATSLVVASGTGGLFGTVFPKLITVARSGVVLCILEATARATDTLTISGAVEGTTDANMLVGDVVEIRPTALSQTEIQAAVHNLETITNVSITASTTLTSAAFGKYQVCSGTSANYTVTLPTAVGGAGQTIGIRMALGLTKLVSLACTGGQTIDGAATRIMWAGESALLESDGSNWVKLGGKSIPMTCQLQRASTDFSIATAGWFAVPMDALALGTALLYDSTDGQVVAVRPGIYSCLIFAYCVGAAAGVILYAAVSKNAGQSAGFSVFQSGGGSNAGPAGHAATFALAVGDTVNVDVNFISQFPGTIAGTAAPATLTVAEIPQW